MVSAALALGAGAVILLPSMVEVVGLVARGNRPPPTHFDALWEAIWLVALILITGYILEALSRSMYQVLEGYKLWPRWLTEHKRRQHVASWQRLQRQFDSTANAAPDSFEAFNRPFVYERLKEYPFGEQRIAPTRLGNVMRAMETYGETHYGLDSQRLWYELTTVAPGPLQLELMRSRQSVDFFVATIYMSSLFGMAAILTGVLENVTGLSGQKNVLTFGVTPTGPASIGPVYFGMTAVHIGLGTAHILLGLVILALIPVFSYRMAVEMAKVWTLVVRALVNLGRIRLAEDLHLSLPSAHEVEIKLWEAVQQFVGAREADAIRGWAREVDKHRTRGRPANMENPNEDDT